VSIDRAHACVRELLPQPSLGCASRQAMCVRCKCKHHNKSTHRSKRNFRNLRRDTDAFHRHIRSVSDLPLRHSRTQRHMRRNGTSRNLRIDTFHQMKWVFGSSCKTNTRARLGHNLGNAGSRDKSCPRNCIQYKDVSLCFFSNDKRISKASRYLPPYPFVRF
jgi:hypothetical protein